MDSRYNAVLLSFLLLRKFEVLKFLSGCLLYSQSSLPWFRMYEWHYVPRKLRSLILMMLQLLSHALLSLVKTFTMLRPIF